MPNGYKKISAEFYKSSTGKEPVRDWLKSLSKEDKKIIGDDIKTVEIGWPVGMSICRSIRSHKGLREVRSSLTDGRISRILFCIVENRMILLHGFFKTTQKTPPKELKLAVKRQQEVNRG